MNLGENIYKYRTLKNWSQSDLAEALNVSRQSVSKWENNAAMPDLDKLMKMREIFGISLDELVYGPQEKVDVQEQPSQIDDQSKTNLMSLIPFRILAGTVMMIFGMIFFLLSIFWGDQLYFGESFGELFSIVIVLISIALIAPYSFKIFSICSIIYFLYSVIYIGILKMNNLINSIFTIIASFVIVIWFIVCGTHANRSNTKS